MNQIFNATEARKSFELDGFYIARGLLPISLIHACLTDIADILMDQARQSEIVASPGIFENARALHSADIEQFKKVLAALWRLQSVGDIFAHKTIRQFLVEVLGFARIFVPGGQSVHLQSEGLKIPGGYFGLEAHQDWPSVQGSLDGVGVWAPLCDIDEQSYPLEIVPGSHMRGLIEPSAGKMDAQWVVDEFDDAAYCPLCVMSGDVVFFSNFLVHRSGLKGRHNFVRLACSTRFDNGSELTFIDRAYPTAYKRDVYRKLMNFPNVLEVNRQLAKFRLGE